MEFVDNAPSTTAAAHDLERLRVFFSDGNSQCSTTVNYYAFTERTLHPLFVRPS